jgi:5,10-methylenetetrahydromethanopterin reductase
MKLSLASRGAEPCANFLEQIELAELLGFHAFVHCDKQWARELFSRLGAATQVSTRLGLGAGVVDPYTRHAALLAQAGATLAEMAPGRFRVIIGIRGPFETLPGFGKAPPIPALREAAELMRQLWQGERITLDGELVRLDDGALDWKPSAVPSLCLASRDPEILAAAGEIADGVMIEGFSTATGIQHAKDHIRAGLEASRRDWKDIRLTVWTPVCVLEHAEAQVPEALTREVGAAFWSDRTTLGPMIDRLAADATPAFRKFIREMPNALSPAIMDRLCELMPHGIIDSLTLVGTATQVVDRLKALQAMDIEEVVISPFPTGGQNVVDFMYKLAQDVLPHFSGRAARGS